MSSLGALIGDGKPQPPDTTDLTSLLTHVTQEAAKSFRKAIPAQVSAVSSGNRVDVQPGIKARYNDGTVRPLPIIGGVPVCQPQGQGYAIRLPVAVGDNGLLIIADRCIDPWLAGNGSPADPADPRVHDLTDAVFIPGILTDDDAVASGDTGGDLVLQNGAATLHVQKAGTYRIANPANELVDLTQQLAAAVSSLSSAVTGLTTSGTVSGPTASGPIVSGKVVFSPNSLAALANAAASAAPIIAKIATLKGI